MQNISANWHLLTPLLCKSIIVCSVLSLLNSVLIVYLTLVKSISKRCCCWYLLTALSRQVSAPVVTSQCINLQHVDWNHRSIDSYCRIRNCSCNNNSDCIHKCIYHHYDEGGNRGSNLSISWLDELKICKFNISVHSFCDAISLCRCEKKIVRQLQMTFTLRRSPNIVNNILQLIPDFLVMQTSQQENDKNTNMTSMMTSKKHILILYKLVLCTSIYKS